MNNFGVIELASKRTTSAPGWAYIPDLGPAPTHSVKGKRAARALQGLSANELSARQQAKVAKDLQALDQEGNRDPTITVTQSRSTSAKHIPAVRRILQSQKNFANYLNDFEAQLSHEAGIPNTSSIPAASSKRSKRTSLVATATTAAAMAATAMSNSRHEELDVSTIKDILAPEPPTPEESPASGDPESNNSNNSNSNSSSPPRKHPRDDDPLLESWVPVIPTDDELRKLLAVPPKNYLELQTATGRKTQMRVFCEICGYWGKVKCMKCGVRVCALDCLNVHREECITRYGM